MSSPQRKLWVPVGQIQYKLAKRATKSDASDDRYVVRWDSVEISRSLPTAGAVGYQYFVGFANWYVLMTRLTPQLALWATDISLASPTGIMGWLLLV